MPSHYYRAYILGFIWWPNDELYSYQTAFAAEDDEHAIDLAYREGNFSQVVDVQVYRLAVVGSDAQLVKDWDSQEHEQSYYDTLGG